MNCKMKFRSPTQLRLKTLCKHWASSLTVCIILENITSILMTEDGPHGSNINKIVKKKSDLLLLTK